MTRRSTLGWTYRDLSRMADENHYEIYQGYLVKEPAPVPMHQRIVSHLHGSIWQHLPPNEQGGLLTSPVDVVFAEDTVLQPDLIFVRAERGDIIGDRAIQGAPDFVAEVLSPSTRERDLIMKRNIYARHDVMEYWIIDPDLRCIIQCTEPHDAGFQAIVQHDSDATVTSSVMGLQLTVEALFTHFQAS